MDWGAGLVLDKNTDSSGLNSDRAEGQREYGYLGRIFAFFLQIPLKVIKKEKEVKGCSILTFMSLFFISTTVRAASSF